MADDNDDVEAVESSSNYDERVQRIRFTNEIDAKYGFERYTDPTERNGWLINFKSAELMDAQTKQIQAAVGFYFLTAGGDRFKIVYPFRPYFFVAATEGTELSVVTTLSKKFGPSVQIDVIEKEDLDLNNHLSGLRRKYIRLSFLSVSELLTVRKELQPIVRRNQQKLKDSTTYTTLLRKHMGGLERASRRDVDDDMLTNLIDIREYDVPYHMRVCIDEKIFVGLWYSVKGLDATRKPKIVRHPTLIDAPDPVVLAFDIETTKLPLKFPDSSIDHVMMISYMIDGRGYLICNREIVSADIENFEFTPKEEFHGEFTVFNEADEKGTLARFFDHIRAVRPSVICTYNGDSFDWYLCAARAAVHGVSMLQAIGFAKDSNDEYKCSNCIHMDAFRWVKRDSYLPVGSQNLKAVAKAKLRYDPVEVDPEAMCAMARDQPQNLANYSVSDAVTTYYLYMKYVHPFIFALCTIIPLDPDDVLRKGSGTLCEALLMVEAFHNNIIFPNKVMGAEAHTKSTSDGHLIEQETYVGGHVEALEAGIFRADLATRFRLVPQALQQLIAEAEDTLRDELVREMKVDMETVADFESRVQDVRQQLEALLKQPSRVETPRIYHLDVGAMYPNIILTNRLQPCAMVTDETCMACDFNTSEAQCKRHMQWMWRAELLPASRGEVERARQQLEHENFGKPPRPFHAMPKEERLQIERKRLQDYCKRAYGRLHITRQEPREQRICQRENSFYVDTVRAFRDRRYEYKEMLKKAKGALDALNKDDVSSVKTAQGRVVLYESLQLAHKCILNSFYGYVMRKGSRWFSMEMAGIVCHTGANIITEARKLVEQIGRPLELDTDGIWCLLPTSFPEDVKFELRNCAKKSVTISYPGAMLNFLVRQKFTNPQYHTLREDGGYDVSSENSIFFEVDGPYQAMVLPASKEEGKKLKKRYAVFNMDGSLAELKGFEVKRRGELNIIKIFQSAVFKSFLRGSSLEEAYASAAEEANYWLNVLYSHGAELNDDELFELISENRSMSRKLEDYGSQQSTSITTAKRLAEFLGADMVRDAGLACRFVISRFPLGAPVTERTIPVAIFSAAAGTKLHYLRKWTKRAGMQADECNMRELLDWTYYVERLGSCVQKIITIPAAMQGVSNPVPRVAHPDWLEAKIRQRVSDTLQPKITDIFRRQEKGKSGGQTETDDAEGGGTGKKRRPDESPKPLEKKTIQKDGVDAWLQWLKAKWADAKKRKAQEAKDQRQSGVAGGAKLLAQHGVRGLVDAARTRIHQLSWQIVAIDETAEPGVFTLWALLDGAMQRLSVRVERRLLVNERRPRADARPEAKHRVLPRAQPVLHLYEHVVDEERFGELLADLDAELYSHRVQGVYESRVPSLFQALLQLGAVARLAPDVKAVRPPYALADLRMADTGSASTSGACMDVGSAYLGDCQLRSLFLYEYSVEKRAVMALFDAASSKATLVVQNSTPLQLPAMGALYAQLYEKWLDELRADSQESHMLEQVKGSVRERLEFQVVQISTARDLEREVTKALRAARQASARPTILLTLTKDANLHKRWPSLLDTPRVRVHVTEADGLFGQLDWQNLAARRACQHYLHSFLYLQNYVDAARFVNLPLGNVPRDVSLLALDLFYARALRKKGMVLWCSPVAQPDLGGKELDDKRLGAAGWEQARVTRAAHVLHERAALEPACCVELTIGMAHPTALIQWARILEHEGTCAAVSYGSTAPALPVEAFGAEQAQALGAFDESGAVNEALQPLRDVLLDCMRTIVSSNSAVADQLVQDFHRWLCSSEALLHDPRLVEAVETLTRKLCLLLMAECERLGAKVLFLSTTRIVLATQRKNRDQAQVFTKALLEQLAANSLFRTMSLKETATWSTMLWRDAANFAGIRETETEAGEEKENRGPEGDDEADDVAVLKEKQPHAKQILESRWKLADEIAATKSGEELRDTFEKLVIGYLLVVREDAPEKEPTGDEADAECARRRRLILADVGAPLARALQRHGVLATQRLVRAVCRALGADALATDALLDLQDAVRRKIVEIEGEGAGAELMEKVAVEPGNDESEEEGRDNDGAVVGMSCHVPRVFCAACSQSSDCDLLLQTRNAADEPVRCQTCGERIAVAQLEWALLERVRRLHTAFLLQDHVCAKCRSVRNCALREHCTCASDFSNEIRTGELARELRAIRRAAERLHLRDVDEAAGWVLDAI